MEFTVSKADLVRELSLSQGVVEKKTTIPILSNVLLEARGDRLLSDCDRSGTGTANVVSGEGEEGRLGHHPGAKKLLDYVRLLPDADITVKFAENHWASFTCGRSRTRIAGMSRESFPELPAMPETWREIPVKQLTAMIARTMFAISMEESRFTLNGALLLLGDKGADHGGDRRSPAGLRAAADARWSNGQRRIPGAGAAQSDGRRSRSSRDDPRRRKVPVSAATITICSSNSARGLLITRKLTGNFPDYERVLPQDNTHIATLVEG